MIICESEFNFRDPNNHDIALTEVDYYAWIQKTEGMPNHRLSLRYRFSTGNYEIYRCMMVTQNAHFPTPDDKGEVTVIQHVSTGEEFVAFKSPDLQAAIDFADGEWLKYHSEGRGASGLSGRDDHVKDRVCKHERPDLAFSCRKGR